MASTRPGGTVLSGADDGSVTWPGTFRAARRSAGPSRGALPTTAAPPRPCFAVNPAGTIMATDEYDGTVDLVDLRTLGGTPASPPPAPVANGLAFTPDGRLVTGDEGGNITSGTRGPGPWSEGCMWRIPVTWLAVSPDGTRLAVQTQAGRLDPHAVSP